MVFDSSIANEADHLDQELHLKTSEEIMDVDNRTNGPSVESGVLANLQARDFLVILTSYLPDIIKIFWFI